MTRLTLLTLAALFGLAAPAAAHPVPFSFVDVRVQPAAVDVTVVVHVFDVGHDVDVAPPERLLEAPTLASNADAIVALVKTRLQLTADGTPLRDGAWSAPEPLAERQSLQLSAHFAVGNSPGTVAVTTVMFPYDPVHQTFVNFYERDTIATQAILDRVRTTVEFFAASPRGVRSILREFALSGMRHILAGADHLIFIFGLLLLGGSMRRLMLIVSAFTAAHVVTVTLAAFNFITPSLRFVEPGIALSIVYVGADNLMVRGGRDVRPWIASAFGLIHGFGYAAVLRELNLSRRALGWSLFSFNLGVELAQLLAVAAIALALTALRNRSETAGRRIAFAGSILVIATGTVWFIQKVFFPGGMA